MIPKYVNELFRTDKTPINQPKKEERINQELDIEASPKEIQQEKYGNDGIPIPPKEVLPKETKEKDTVSKKEPEIIIIEDPPKPIQETAPKFKKGTPLLKIEIRNSKKY